MTSSGFKRGLAATAIAALAVSGSPLLASTASAVDLNTQAGGANVVNLITPFYGPITNHGDGTYRLQAIGGNNISSVRFEYSLNGTTWTTIATVASRNDNGSFATEWAAAGLDGASIDVRAVGLDGSGNTVDDDQSSASVDHSAPDVDVANGNTLGVFQQPYTNESQTSDWVVISGTDEYADGVWGAWYDSSIDDYSGWSFVDNSDSPNGAYSVGVNIDGYVYGASDQITMLGENNASNYTEDTEAFNLYKQVITTVTASAADSQVPAGGTSDVTVTVKDQNGNPIDGAQVFDSNGSGPEYTAEDGTATFAQTPGSTYYYANATDSNPYEPELGDKKSDSVTVTQYNPAPTSLAGSSDDGAAFDNDEYDANDITVQVKDQNGNNYDTTDPAQVLQYHWVFTPFDGGASERTPTTGELPVLTETNGKFIVPMPTLDADGGTYELFAALTQDSNGNNAIASSKVLTVKAGDSNFVFDEDSPEQSTVGGSEAVGVTLELNDGTGLPNRPVTFSLTSSDNALYDQDSGADASTYSTKTDANGHATATLDDPNSDTATERDTVYVETDDWTDAGGDTDNANENASQDVVFASSGASAADASITLGPDDGAHTNPGEVKTLGGTLTDNDTDGPGNTQVNLTTDHGYFTNAAGTANYGQATTVVTDGAGDFVFYLTIGRDAGFDDNGDVTSTVTATSGTAQDSAGYDWTTDGTTTGSKVDLVFSSDQTVTVLPKAPFETENVCFDVYAYDDFGNPIDNVAVTVDGDFVGLTQAAADDNDTSHVALTTDLKDDCDVVASQSHAGDQDYTATWANAQVNPAPAPNSDLTDTETIQWYAIQVASATLTASGTNPHPVGDTVTMTYKAVDQNGEPIDGYSVEFYRSGPDNTHDGSLETTKTTNANGEAFYVFQGEVKGTARVTTVLYDTNGDIVPAGQASDDVVFGTTKVNPSLVVRGRDNGAKDDKIVARAINKTAGATVRLYKKTATGLKLLETSTMNDKGNHKFVGIKDKNGNKRTKYVVKVSATQFTTKGVGGRKVR